MTGLSGVGRLMVTPSAVTSCSGLVVAVIPGLTSCVGGGLGRRSRTGPLVSPPGWEALIQATCWVRREDLGEERVGSRQACFQSWKKGLFQEVT